MRRDILQRLERWISSGPRQMGEVLIRSEDGQFSLCHFADEERRDLKKTDEAWQAREIALATEEGEYRPLKTAPTLLRGWRLELRTLEELRLALDLLYPAMLGLLVAHEEQALGTTSLRATLGRQSGMYAVTRKLTDDQAQELIGSFCRSDGGCLKTILWEVELGKPIRSLPSEKFDPTVSQCSAIAPVLPMLCHEACNLLVAKAREVVKSSMPPKLGAVAGES